jgi:hypothetical protein
MKGIVDMYNSKYQYNPAQLARVDNTGVLIASGLIAGEALMGLIFAGLRVGDIFPPEIFPNASFIFSLIVIVLIGLYLTVIPLKNAGDPNEPAPPSAVM